MHEAVAQAIAVAWQETTLGEATVEGIAAAAAIGVVLAEIKQSIEALGEHPGLVGMLPERVWGAAWMLDEALAALAALGEHDG